MALIYISVQNYIKRDYQLFKYHPISVHIDSTELKIKFSALHKLSESLTGLIYLSDKYYRR